MYAGLHSLLSFGNVLSSANKQTVSQIDIPDKSQGDDIVGVDSNKPITVFTVWVGVWVVG